MPGGRLASGKAYSLSSFPRTGREFAKTKTDLYGINFLKSSDYGQE